jgi:hypothetical protein
MKPRNFVAHVLKHRLVTACTVAALVLASSPANATVEGKNGRIAFRQYLNGAQTRGAIFTVKPGGTGLRQVTHPARKVITTEPDWSPNGRWIVYHREKEERTQVFKVRRNGSHRINLSRTSCTKTCLGEAFPACRRMAGGLLSSATPALLAVLTSWPCM